MSDITHKIKVEDFIKHGLSIITTIFTYKFLSLVMNPETTADYIVVIVFAPLVTMMEIHVFKEWKKTGHDIYLIFGIAIGLISLMGSISCFNAGLDKSIMESDEYRRLSDQAEQLKINAERYSKINYITKSNETITKRDSVINEMTKLKNEGAGLGASAYKIYADLTGLTLQSAAIIFIVFIASIVETGVFYFNNKNETRQRNATVNIAQPKLQVAQQTVNNDATKVSTVDATATATPKAGKSRKIDVKNAAIAQYKTQLAAQQDVNMSAIARNLGVTRQRVSTIISNYKKDQKTTFGFNKQDKG